MSAQQQVGAGLPWNILGDGQQHSIGSQPCTQDAGSGHPEHRPPYVDVLSSNVIVSGGGHKGGTPMMGLMFSGKETTDLSLSTG